MSSSDARVPGQLRRGRRTAVLLGLGLCAFWVLLATSRASAILTECPPVGVAAGCDVLITIPAVGSPFLTVDGTQPPYDGFDDSLVGVLNNSGHAVPGLSLTGANIFGFDGDGATTLLPPPHDSTGYAGPGTQFNVTDLDNGNVLFTNGLAPRHSLWFSLESDPTSAAVTPEPETLALMAPGVAAMLGVWAAPRIRRVRNRSARRTAPS